MEIYQYTNDKLKMKINLLYRRHTGLIEQKYIP